MPNPTNITKNPRNKATPLPAPIIKNGTDVTA